jgi:hypothetical protein
LDRLAFQFSGIALLRFQCIVVLKDQFLLLNCNPER